MYLSQVLPDLVKDGAQDLKIKGIAYDSRRVKPGYLFFCIKGFRQNGHNFLDQAIQNGAAAAIVEQPVDDKQIQTFQVENCRQALAQASASFYHRPGDHLKITGITGTNGKTTVSYFIDSIHTSAGFKTGLIGTIHYKINGRSEPAARTTPESLDLQYLLSRMLRLGVSHVAMEVSSHALALDRVLGVEFNTAVLTNVTHDHLDFHSDLKEYRATKAKLFKSLGKNKIKQGKRLAVLNTDDPFVDEFLPDKNIPVISFGLNNRALIKADRYWLFPEETQAVLNLAGCQLPVKISLPGRFNLYNALAAAAVAYGEGIAPETIKAGLEKLKKVPGRCNILHTNLGFKVVIDFAHNPDALAQLLTLQTPLPGGRKILVFGCEGEKDRLKRPIMGAIAGKMADYVILTSDNLYYEDAGQIVNEVMNGLINTCRPGCYEVIIDRCLAIKRALDLAKKGDLVLIAGKGHEKNIIIKGRYLPFNDYEVVSEVLGSALLNNKNKKLMELAP